MREGHSVKTRAGRFLALTLFVIALPGALPVILAVAVYGIVTEMRRPESEGLGRLSLRKEPHYRLLLKEGGENRLLSFHNEGPAVGFLKVKRSHRRRARLWLRDPAGGLEEIHPTK